MKARDFLDTTDLSPTELGQILDLAAQLKSGSLRAEQALRGRVLAMVFMDPSLRTRTSFEVAMVRHGGHAVVLEPGRSSWALETRRGVVMDGTSVEHIAEAARVLGRYADAVALRAFPKGTSWEEERHDRTLRDFAQYCEKPLINLESTRRHPCQGLADALLLRERLGPTKGRRFTLTWGPHPKALPTAVPASAALAAAQLGMQVTIAHPPGFELDPDDVAAIGQAAQDAGGSLAISHDQGAALHGAEAIYVKSWGAVRSFGRPEEEAALRAPHRGWKFSTALLKQAAPSAFVMHCLPVRRNVEIDEDVLDGPQAAVIDQAENRLHVQRALLLQILGDESARGNEVRS
jgi:N-acetylornithine carbamoyltransferase